MDFLGCKAKVRSNVHTELAQTKSDTASNELRSVTQTTTAQMDRYIATYK